MKQRYHFMKGMLSGILLISFTFVLASCMSGDDKTITLEAPSTGIPDDSEARANPEIGSATTYIPNIQTTVDDVNGTPVINIIMTGVKNSDSYDWLRLYGTGLPNQNIWVEVDDTPKGILVINNGDDANLKVANDIVFTIDNSGSMSEEADAIARDIISWAEQLANSGLDSRFGIVGYGGYISGAMNLTNVTELSNYLNAKTGVNRTIQFGGSDSNQLASYASAFKKTSSSLSSYECGAMAIQFANKYFSFRTGSNRIYVNLTDEPNQPNGYTEYSVKYFESQDNWPASNGTVHTVYSGSTFATSSWNYSEQPWLISEYTGGTTLYASSSFSGITLSSLPVTGAMQHSYTIMFTNIEDKLDGKTHKVHITIRSTDGTVCADKVFYVVFK